jgi:hypothetical protein
MKKSLNTFDLALIATLVLSCQMVAPGQSADTDPLKPYTKCKSAVPDLKIREVTRRPGKADPFREVEYNQVKHKVSVLDGYRVMFAFPDLPYFFANVKIEQSAPDSFEQDKQILIDELKFYTTTKEATPMIFSDKALLNGFDHYGLDRGKIDVGGQVGIHTLFHGPKHLVVTIYFLNQSKAIFGNNRRFDTIEQYQEIRDKFLSSYSECLKTVADTP